MKPNIYNLRKERGWTQKELGQKFKVPKAPEIICRWEKGIISPDAKNLMELAEILGVSVNQLFD